MSVKSRRGEFMEITITRWRRWALECEIIVTEYCRLDVTRIVLILSSSYMFSHRGQCFDYKTLHSDTEKYAQLVQNHTDILIIFSVNAKD